MIGKIIALPLLIFGVISNAQTWEIKKEAPVGIANTQPPTILDKNIFFLVDKNYLHDSIAYFNLGTSDWSVLSTKLIWNRHHGATASFNGKIYLAGGCVGDNDSVRHYRIGYTEMYDPSVGKWSTCNSILTPRAGFQLVTFQEKIFAIGGFDDSIPINTIEMYDPKTDKWTEKAKAPWKKSLCCWGAGIFENQIYFLGRDANGIVFMSYNPVNDAFQNIKSNLPENLDSPGICICNNYMIIAGGAINNPQKKVYAYDFRKMQWLSLADLPSPRAFPCTLCNENKVYVIGGIGPEWDWNNPNKTVFEIDLNIPFVGQSINTKY